MKKIFIVGLLALPIATMAEEANDTTIVYNGKQIVISEDSLETHVSVYAPNGSQLRKTKESSFAEEQEVERFFISSPFFNWGSARQYFPTKPDFYCGFLGVSGSALGFGDSDNMPVKTFRSFEMGMPYFDAGIFLNKRQTWSISLIYEALVRRYSFDSHHILLKDTDSRGTVVSRPDGVGSSHLFSFDGRIKCMFKWYNYLQHPDADRLSIGAGFSIDTPGIYNYSSHSQDGYHYADAARLKQKMRLALDLQVSYAGFIVYFQKSLTPLFKDGYGPKCYPFSFGLGFAL